MISRGSKLLLEYAVFSENGKVIDTNIGDEPFVFHLGDHQILPELEKAIESSNIGDTLDITLSPKNAYGEIDQRAFQEISLNMVPPELRHPGALINVIDSLGNQYNSTIKSINNDIAIVDLNHPLAGKTLNFALKVSQAQ